MAQNIFQRIKNKRKATAMSQKSWVGNIEIRRLANRANTRIRRLEKAMKERGIRSSAYEDIGGERFHFNRKMSKDDFISEATRMFNFLSNPSSTVRGANIETSTLSALKYGELFGKQWLSDTWRHAYSPTLDKDILTKVFSDYRKLEEDKAGIIYDGYGSTELISYLYDLYIEGSSDALVEANKALNDYYLEQQRRYKDNISSHRMKWLS